MKIIVYLPQTVVYHFIRGCHMINKITYLLQKFQPRTGCKFRQLTAPKSERVPSTFVPASESLPPKPWFIELGL